MPIVISVNPLSQIDTRHPDVPASRFFAITPSDTDELATGTLWLYVGVSGDVKVIGINDDASSTGTVLKSMPVGWHRVAARQILATGTAATNLVGAI